MSRSCVCGGSNENCRFCSGSGTIPDGLASALVTHIGRPDSEYMVPGGSQQGKKRTTVRAPRNLIPCPKGCGAMVSSLRLERHVKKIHGVVPATPTQDEGPHQIHSVQNDIEKPVAAMPTVTRTLENVPTGIAGFVKKLRDAKASVEGLTRSLISTVHNGPNPMQSHAGSKKSSQTFEVCAVCKAKVRATRIGMHMAKVHKQRPALPSASAKVKVSSKYPASRISVIHPDPSYVPKASSDTSSAVSSVRVNAPATTTGRKVESLLETCPVCKASVRPDRMSRHFLKAHSGRKKRKGKKSHGSHEPYFVSGGLPSLGKRR